MILEKTFSEVILMTGNSPIVHNRIVFVGDCGVGKTSILRAYLKIEAKPLPTVMSDSIPIKVVYQGVDVSLSVWDTAGQVDFRSLIPIYTRNAHVAVLVFAVDHRPSFQNVESWMNVLRSSTQIPHVILVANKIDESAKIETAEMIAESDRLECSLFLTSAKTAEGVDSLFMAIAERVLSSAKPKPSETEPEVHFNPVDVNRPSICGC
jgi:small GTP-binding protein